MSFVPIAAAIMAEWKRITAAATPSPWCTRVVEGNDLAPSKLDLVGPYVPNPLKMKTDILDTITIDGLPCFSRDEDAIFTGAARGAMPILIAEAEQAREILTVMEEFSDCCPFCKRYIDHADDCRLDAFLQCRPYRPREIP